jgi:CheY-like chemotaxis protein
MSHANEEPYTQKLQGKRILIVEDYAVISEIISEALGFFAHPSQVHTGRDALEQIEQQAPDIISLGS